MALGRRGDGRYGDDKVPSLRYRYMVIREALSWIKAAVAARLCARLSREFILVI